MVCSTIEDVEEGGSEEVEVGDKGFEGMRVLLFEV